MTDTAWVTAPLPAEDTWPCASSGLLCFSLPSSQGRSTIVLNNFFVISCPSVFEAACSVMFWISWDAFPSQMSIFTGISVTWSHRLSVCLQHPGVFLLMSWWLKLAVIHCQGWGFNRLRKENPVKCIQWDFQSLNLEGSKGLHLDGPAAHRTSSSPTPAFNSSSYILVSLWFWMRKAMVYKPSAPRQPPQQ